MSVAHRSLNSKASVEANETTMPLRKYASPEEAREAARLRNREYRKAYVLSDEQRERYKEVARAKYANNPDYRASKIEKAKIAKAKRRGSRRPSEDSHSL